MKLRATFSKRHLLVLLLTLSAIAAGMGSRAARPLRHTAGLLLPPLADAPMYLVTQVSGRADAEPSAGMTAAEARRLRESNASLRREVTYWQHWYEVYRRRAEDVANFQRMYGPTRDLGCEMIPARVVLGGSLPYDRTREVNPGGARTGSAVTTRLLATQRAKALPPKLAAVHANSLVGRIIDSGAFSARLQLVTDRDFRIHARVRRVLTGEPRMVNVMQGNMPRMTVLKPANNHPIEGIARGDGDEHVIVEDVKEYLKVRPGDELLTSPAGGRFPTEIRIGSVVAVRRSKDPRRVVLRVRPHADLGAVRDVYILSPLRPPAEE